MCNPSLNNYTSKQKPSACRPPGIKTVHKPSLCQRWSLRFKTENFTMRCVVRTITGRTVRRDLITYRRWNEDYQEKIEDARRRNCSSAISSSMNRHTWRHQEGSPRLWCKNPTSKDPNWVKGVPLTAEINSQQIKSNYVPLRRTFRRVVKVNGNSPISEKLRIVKDVWMCVADKLTFSNVWS
jgi:hypothetical protein